MSDVPWDFGDGQWKDANMQPSLSITVINDPVHGHMEFHPLCMKVVNTPQFQRLRNLKQLGGCYMVYPGAAHNRFEHCLGVSYLAMKVTATLKLRQPELDITDEDVLCVAIAGLCHDLGHGPFSHLFEVVLKESGSNWTHEEASEKMFDFMWKENKLEDEFKKYGMDSTHKEVIKRLIAGKPTDKEKQAKGFLFQIVANNRNGIDVDKWDYLARDALNTGMPSSFDHRRLMKFVRAIKDGNDWVLCTRDKEVSNVYEMFKQRHLMHERVYNHKVVRCVEEMIKDALQAATESKAVTYPGEKEQMKDIFECANDMEAFVLLDDSVLNRILTTILPAGLEKEKADKLKEAQGILRRIFNRDLYRCVAETSPLKTVETEEEKEKRKSIENFKREGLIVKKSPLSYEKEKSNPVDKMRFYSKLDLDKATVITQKEVSLFLPSVYSQETYRLISRKRPSDTTVQQAIREFKEECKKVHIEVTVYCRLLDEGNDSASPAASQE